MLCLSFVGLGLIALTDKFTPIEGVPFSKTNIGHSLQMALSIIWTVNLILFFPIRLFLDRPQSRKLEKMLKEGQIDFESIPAAQRAILRANYGSLPKWIYIPVLAIAFILAAVVLLIILIVVCGLIYSKIHG